MTQTHPGAQGHPSQVNGILIDLYGTLIPMGHQETRVRNLADAAKILGVAPEEFAKSWMDCIEDRCNGKLGSLEETMESLAAAQGVRPTPENLRRAVEKRLEFSRMLLESSVPSLPGLDALRAAGFRLAVVSDASEETPRLWANSALSSRFDTAVFSFNVGVCKPDPRMYRTALERLQLPPSRCVYVGDGGSRELTGAEAVGLSAFLYRYPDDELDSARYDPDTSWSGTRLNDLQDLLRVLPPPPRAP